MSPVPTGWRERYGVGDDEVEHMEDAYRILCQRQGTVSVFRFQRCAGDLFVHTHHLALNLVVTSHQINVLPFEAQKFTPPQTGSQFQGRGESLMDVPYRLGAQA